MKIRRVVVEFNGRSNGWHGTIQFYAQPSLMTGAYRSPEDAVEQAWRLCRELAGAEWVDPELHRREDEGEKKEAGTGQAV